MLPPNFANFERIFVFSAPSIILADLLENTRYPAASQMIDGTEKPKIPLKFTKRAALYNELGCKNF